MSRGGNQDSVRVPGGAYSGTGSGGERRLSDACSSRGMEEPR